MASYNDVIVTDAAWVDLYSVVGAVTTATLIIQNKSTTPVYYVEAVSAPLISSTQGVVIAPMSPMKTVTLKSGEKVFLKAFDGSSSVLDTATIAVVLG